MGIFQGKTSTERNKMIAAAVLGVVALVALYMAFGRNLFGSTTTAQTTGSPTPSPTVSSVNVSKTTMPTTTEQDFVYQTTPVVYNPGDQGAPDAGRNIFAFYEPPPPCPECETPKPIVTPPPPTPTPTPPMMITMANPQSVYAGSKAFRLEVSGERFSPASRLYFNQAEVPTRFVNEQRLIADIPANFIAQEGPRQLIVQTPDGKLYSNATFITVQAPPRPTFQYIGMIARARNNNNTAYFIEPGRSSSPTTNAPPPFGARLNDVVGGRFRLINIAANEVMFEDVSLGFKHRVPISKATQTASASGPLGQPGRGFPDGGFVIDPNNRGVPGIPGFPGIPANVQPQPQPSQPRRTTEKKEDVDDDGDGGY
jgi:hypothetical protein